jgi:hypothetical protein
VKLFRRRSTNDPLETSQPAQPTSLPELLGRYGQCRVLKTDIYRDYSESPFRGFSEASVLAELRQLVGKQGFDAVISDGEVDWAAVGAVKLLIELDQAVPDDLMDRSLSFLAAEGLHGVHMSLTRYEADRVRETGIRWTKPAVGVHPPVYSDDRFPSRTYVKAAIRAKLVEPRVDRKTGGAPGESQLPLWDFGQATATFPGDYHEGNATAENRMLTALSGLTDSEALAALSDAVPSDPPFPGVDFGSWEYVGASRFVQKYLPAVADESAAQRLIYGGVLSLICLDVLEVNEPLEAADWLLPQENEVLRDMDPLVRFGAFRSQLYERYPAEAIELACAAPADARQSISSFIALCKKYEVAG